MAVSNEKRVLFENTPIPKALATLAIPTIISQMINVIYNMVDAFFIGRTGNSYMMAATTITLTIMIFNVAFANLFGVGGGSLISRLMGQRRDEEAKTVSAFSFYGVIVVSLVYSFLIWLFMDHILYFMGASADTIDYARQYVRYVIVIGCAFNTTSQAMAFLLRNTGYAKQASFGLSGGGILNMFLDPLFMFVILPKGLEVTGAAVATLISNVCSFTYLLTQMIKASKTAPLSISPAQAGKISRSNMKNVFSVGIPSALLLAMFDLANICANKIASSHSDLVLAGLGIVMKIERIPNGINIGISQGLLPLVAYNFASGNHERMQEAIRYSRKVGFIVSGICIVLLEIAARPVTNFFLSTRVGDTASALVTVALAARFLRIRCLASPFQFINYSSSYNMQGMGNGRGTLIHAFVRELVFYIPYMFLLDKLFGENGLAAALPVGEACGAVAALLLVRYTIKKAQEKRSAQGASDPKAEK